MNDDLIALLREARKLLSQGDFSTGYCCCGDPMDTHGYMGPHGPVDAGSHAATDLAVRIDAALAEPDDLVALSDVASLQRWGPAPVFGQCRTYTPGGRAEMEEDDEGEFILLADVLRLKEKV